MYILSVFDTYPERTIAFLVIGSSPPEELRLRPEHALGATSKFSSGSLSKH